MCSTEERRTSKSATQASDSLKKLYQSAVFNTDSPKTLLNKVFFKIMLWFCCRGRQNLCQLKKSHFAVMVDASGKKFVTKVVDELTKNHRENDEAEQGGMMYATKANSVLLRLLRNIYSI
jgi:hypothetical protein